MNIRNMTQIFIILVVCVTVTFQFACAAGIKERMMQRLPVIADLKAKGIIGENNRGYLGFVTEKKVQQEIIDAENKDRKAVYGYFAEQQKTSIDVVEKIQAKRKADKTNSGEFFQNEKGEWIKK